MVFKSQKSYALGHNGNTLRHCCTSDQWSHFPAGLTEHPPPHPHKRSCLFTNWLPCLWTPETCHSHLQLLELCRLVSFLLDKLHLTSIHELLSNPNNFRVFIQWKRDWLYYVLGVETEEVVVVEIVVVVRAVVAVVVVTVLVLLLCGGCSISTTTMWW